MSVPASVAPPTTNRSTGFASAPAASTHTPSAAASTSITLGTFNCHDLFDIAHPNPNNTHPETPAQYGVHLSKLAAAIQTLGDPDILGLTEVEDPTVIKDLLAEPQFKNEGYQFTMFPTNDAYGHGEAMLYKPSAVTLESSTESNPQYPDTDGQTGVNPNLMFDSAPLIARFDVQGAASATAGATQLTVILNHMKSMVGGPAEDARRAAEGTFVGNLVDQQTAANPNANVVVMGDLNSFAGKPEFDNIMTRPDGTQRMYDTASQLPASGRYSYSYSYHGSPVEHDLLDHILVTPNLASDVSAVTIPHFDSNPNPARIADPTAADGASDHDPVGATLTL